MSSRADFDRQSQWITHTAKEIQRGRTTEFGEDLSRMIRTLDCSIEKYHEARRSPYVIETLTPFGKAHTRAIYIEGGLKKDQTAILLGGSTSDTTSTGVIAMALNALGYSVVCLPQMRNKESGLLSPLNFLERADAHESLFGQPFSSEMIYYSQLLPALAQEVPLDSIHLLGMSAGAPMMLGAAHELHKSASHLWNNLKSIDLLSPAGFGKYTNVAERAVSVAEVAVGFGIRESLTTFADKNELLLQMQAVHMTPPYRQKDFVQLAVRCSSNVTKQLLQTWIASDAQIPIHIGISRRDMVFQYGHIMSGIRDILQNSSHHSVISPYSHYPLNRQILTHGWMIRGAHLLAIQLARQWS